MPRKYPQEGDKIPTGIQKPGTKREQIEGWRLVLAYMQAEVW
jgi:hypothetical protein